MRHTQNLFILFIASYCYANIEDTTFNTPKSCTFGTPVRFHSICTHRNTEGFTYFSLFFMSRLLPWKVSKRLLFLLKGQYENFVSLERTVWEFCFSWEFLRIYVTEVQEVSFLFHQSASNKRSSITSYQARLVGTTTPNAYSLHLCPRVGGSCIDSLLVLCALSFTPFPLPSLSSFEAICGTVSGRWAPIFSLCIWLGKQFLWRILRPSCFLLLWFHYHRIRLCPWFQVSYW